MLGFEQPFMAEVLQVVMDILGEHYGELIQRRAFILEAATQEEERFLQTLDVGLTLLDEVIAEVLGQNGTAIPGDRAFRLYDTYGFPLDLTRDVAKEHGLSVDEAGFRAEMEAQRERARAAQHFEMGQEEELYRSLELPATTFVGYETAVAPACILAVVSNGQVQQKADAGQQVEVVLDRSPFYGESGGQVGDVGTISGPRGHFAVQDTRHPLPDLTVHYGQVVDGAIAVGDEVEAQVNAERRLDIARNHTATHLLHHALQKVLGEHARQAGSLVAQDRLRFDFTHLQPVSPEQLRQVEREVNAAVRANLPVEAEVTSFHEARSRGAMALFGEKYGDRVRMISVGDDQSRELCGGTHLQHTGQIGFFHIVSESSVGSGLRRIEAVTGRGAEGFVHQQLDLLAQTAEAMQTQPADLVPRAREMTEQLREQQQQIEKLRSEGLRETVQQLSQQAHNVAGIQVLAAQVEADAVERLRQMIDRLREQLKSAVIVLAAVVDGKPTIVAAITPDLIDKGLHAGRLVDQLARVVGGRGGGRPTMAQAGGRDATKLGEALHRVPTEVEQQLKAGVHH
jgi:alanyl-tRNA synthetase